MDVTDVSSVKNQINPDPQPIIFKNGDSYFEKTFFLPSRKNSLVLIPKNSDIFKRKNVYRLEFYKGNNLKFTRELPYLDKAILVDTTSDSKTTSVSTKENEVTILIYDEIPDNDRITLKLESRILIDNQLIEKKQKYNAGTIHLNEGDNIFTLICKDAGTFRSQITNQTSASVYVCVFEKEVKDSDIDFDILFSAKPNNKMKKPYNRLIFKQNINSVCTPKLIPAFLNIKKE